MEALGLLFLVIIALAGAYFRSSTARGARGERRVATTLRRQLTDDQYDVFHDITLDSSRGPTQIDHIVVSRYGVFVIETKNYSGWIFGDAASRHWTQVLYRKKYRFMNPLRQNYKHVEAVKSLLGLSDQFIFSVVVFVGKADFKTVLPDNVVYRHELGGLIRSKNDPVLSAAEVESIVRRLSEHQAGSPVGTESPRFSSVRTDPDCPRCGEQMVLRTAKRGRNTGNQFWGCRKFPKCRGIRQI